MDGLAENNKVALIWILGHLGIVSTERTDQLAKAGSSSKLLGPESALGLSCSVGKERIRGWLREQHQIAWEKAIRTRCRQAGVLLGDASGKNLATIMRTLNRRNARLVTQMLSRHGTLNYHMHKLGLSARLQEVHGGKGNKLPCIELVLLM